MGSVCNCGLKSSYKLPHPTTMTASSGTFADDCDSLSSDQDEGETRETSFNSGNKIQILFSVTLCDPNVSPAALNAAPD